MRIFLGWFLFGGVPLVQGAFHTVAVDACRGVDPTEERCWYNVHWDTDRCTTERPCDSLALFYVGADMGCEGAKLKDDRLGRWLRHHAERGHVAVTACLFESLRAANALTVRGQFPRLETLALALKEDSALKKLWTGKRLGMSGHSLGATVPVHYLARHTSPAGLWSGAERTRLCFLDGVYDLRELDTFYHQHSSCAPHRKRALCQRYTGSKNCPYPLPNTPELLQDDLSEVDGSHFAHIQWRLVECGARLKKPKCALFGDWVPAPQIERLCQRIDGVGDRRCEFRSLPQESHLKCAYSPTGMNMCLSEEP